MKDKEIVVEVIEVDICKGSEHDLLDDGRWQEIVADLRRGRFAALIVSPPL